MAKIITDVPAEHVFEEYADALSNIIVDSDSPFTIGILGDWGVGKTSLMKTMKEKLEEKSEIIPIWFNAWKCEKEKEFAIFPLLGTIYTKIKDDTLKDNFLSFVQSFNINLGIVNAEFKPSEKNLTYLYYDKLEGFKNSLKKSNKKIVVFVDDLDRCAPDKVLEILESIKVFLDIEGFVYVFGINPRVVEKAIEIKYKDMGISGEDYLEKIIQIPFKIPDWTKEELDKCLEKMYEDIDPNYKKIFEKYKDIILNVIEKTPRQLKRFINSYICEQEVFKKEELDLEIHIVLTILKFKWYDFYIRLFCMNYRDELKTKVEGSKIQKELKNKKELYGFIENKKVKRIIDKIIEMNPTKLSKYRRAGMIIPKILEPEINIEKLVTLLNLGKIEEFNELRKGMKTIDLSKIDLYRKQLIRADWRGANLCGANLRRADLSRADLSGAMLIDADLSRADLSGANCMGAMFCRPDLSGTDLSETKMTETFIFDVKYYSNVKVEKTDFKDAIINNKEFATYLRENGAVNVPEVIEDKNKIEKILRKRIRSYVSY